MRRSRAAIGSAAAAAFAAVLYAQTLAPTVGAGDSGELILAAHGLGLPHPPGYALWLLLARLPAAVPLGSVALRVNALSAVASAASVGLLWLLARRIGLRSFGAGVATFLFATATVVWRSAVEAEVYGIATALFLALVLLALRARRGAATVRDRAVFFFAAGLAPVAHQTLLIPAAILAAGVLARDGFRIRRVAAALGWAVCGASLTLVIPVRSSAGPAFAWGDVRGAGAFFDYLLRRDYGGLAQNGFRLDRAVDELTAMGGIIAGSVGWIGAALAAAGGILAGRRRALLGVPVLAALAIPPALAGLIVFTPDAEHLAQIAPFLAPAVAAGALLAGCGADRLLRRAPRRARTGLAVVLAASLLALLPGRHAFADRSGFTLAERYGRDFLADAPDGATLVLEGDNETFLAAYLTRCAGERPDLVLVHRRGRFFGDPYALRGVPRARWNAIQRRVDLERLEQSAGPICYATPPSDLLEAGVRFRQRGLLYRASLEPSGKGRSPGSERPRGERAWRLPSSWRRSSDLLEKAPERYDYVTRKMAVSYSDAAARWLWSEGRVEEALPWFEDAARVGFDFPGAQLNVATAAAAVGKADVALGALAQACRLAPYDPEPAARLAVFLAAMGRTRDAARWFERAFRAAPGSALASDVARAWSLAGDRERAASWRRRAAALAASDGRSALSSGAESQG